jgi:hypothetical protein
MTIGCHVATFGHHYIFPAPDQLQISKLFSLQVWRESCQVSRRRDEAMTISLLKEGRE